MRVSTHTLRTLNIVQRKMRGKICAILEPAGIVAAQPPCPPWRDRLRQRDLQKQESEAMRALLHQAMAPPPNPELH